MLCGEYTGSITFAEKEEDGSHYVWFTVSITTNFPEAYKTLDFAAEIREKKTFELPVPLEIKESTTFQVIVNGEGLNGDPTFTVDPENPSRPYLIEYLPL